MTSSNESAARAILAYGELLWDVLPTGAVLGGAPANFAYRLQTLGHRALTVSKIGVDGMGDAALAQLESHEVDVSLIQRDRGHPTGTVDVVLSAGGDASYTINTGVAYDHIEFTPELEAAAVECAVLYFGSLIQRHDDSRRTLQRLIESAPQAIKLLDLNLRKDCFTAATVADSLARCNILKLNDDEAGVVGKLLGFDFRTLRQFGEQVFERFNVDTCIVTRGAAGAYALSRSLEEARCPGYEVQVADTVGSGDSFTAAFIHQRLAGRPLLECCDFGNRVGALVAGRTGGMCSIPAMEIEHFALTPRVDRSIELRP